MTNRLQYLSQLLESSPNDTFVLFALAKEHENTGADEQALAFYRRLEATDSDYVGLYYHLGKLLERLKNPDEAIKTYKKGIETSRRLQDRHAMSELQGALLEFEDPE
ncbi:MAG: tetratricopeptide repeat protein [Saprospiraceae bacterium]|nr:tetratricopeptide repeat protein [Saprospiraceae bacterium]